MPASSLGGPLTRARLMFDEAVWTYPSSPAASYNLSERIPIMLNQVGMPPPGRTIQRRRRDMEAEEGADTPSGNPLVLSIIAFVTVLALGLAVAWLVLA
jgi:hypothetical protein